MSLDRSNTSDRETERIVRSWLSEGTTRLPDRVLDAVLDEVPSTPQRRVWWPAWRFDTMSNAMRIAIAATAVLVVAFIAIYVLPGRNGSIGNPAATPTASATPSVTVSAGALIDIILAPDSPPPGMSHDGTTAGADALGRPIISRPTTDADLSRPGFVDGRYSEFSNDASGFLSWAILFETIEDAERAYEFYLAEVESEAGYGLGPSAEAGLGDQGICGVAETSDPSSTQVCLWRSGGLVLAVGTYGPVDATVVRAIAEGMQARATGSPAPTSAPATIPEGPTPSPMTLIWSESSLSQDWPAPIRLEPGGAPILVPFAQDTYIDPVGDIGPAGPLWLDIQNVGTGGLSPGPGGVVSVYLAADIPQPVADPSERWIAYGLVLDTNGDGIPDARIGIDNMPATDEPGHRAWRTDLATGQTKSAAGGPYGYVGGRYLDTFFPGESAGHSARFGLGLSPSEPRFRFYAWASMIEGGHVVATDYAPDAGWLEHPDTIP